MILDILLGIAAIATVVGAWYGTGRYLVKPDRPAPVKEARCKHCGALQ